jgi:hypothetical protein
MSLMTTGEAESIEDAIEAPFIECPKCHKQTYGILHVGISCYLRACPHCQIKDGKLIEKPEILPLPKLNKQIIYLDQHVISSIAKAFRPELQRTGTMESHVREGWIKLFHKIDRLRRLQLIVCPFSMFHRRESFIVDDHIRLHLKALYKRLSNGVEFHDPMDMQAVQVLQVARHHLDPTQPVFVRDVNLVTTGRAHSWERYSMKAALRDYDWKPEYREMLAKQKETSDAEFESIYKKWVTGSKKIEDRIDEESKSYGEMVRRSYTSYLVQQGPIPLPAEIAGKMVWDEHAYIGLVDGVYDLFSSGAALTNPFIMRQVMDFFVSDELRQRAPAVRIEPLLWATLARAAQNGKKDMEGDANDIGVIATILPYCDAIVVDNAWRARLSENPAASEVEKYEAQIFSRKNLEELMAYLDQIEAEAPSHVLEAVKEVYGEEFGELDPFDEVSMKLYSQPVEK